MAEQLKNLGYVQHTQQQPMQQVQHVMPNQLQKKQVMMNYMEPKKATKKTGTVKWFSTTKGYGFIECSDGTGDVFVHHTSIHAQGFRSLADNENVEFDLQTDFKGRRQAQHVTGPNGNYVKGAPKPKPLPFNNNNNQFNDDNNNNAFRNNNNYIDTPTNNIGFDNFNNNNPAPLNNYYPNLNYPAPQQPNIFYTNIQPATTNTADYNMGGYSDGYYAQFN